MAHTQRGDEIILDENSHIFNYEVAALAVLSAVQARTLAWAPRHPGPRGCPAGDPSAQHPLSARTRWSVWRAPTIAAAARSIPWRRCERSGGSRRSTGWPSTWTGPDSSTPAWRSGVPREEVAAQADSVTFCLSKGLGAPVGSVVTGTRAFIDRARRARKMLGGGMRQAGVIAAAGIVALETMVDRLREDHENARTAASSCRSLKPRMAQSHSPFASVRRLRR